MPARFNFRLASLVSIIVFLLWVPFAAAQDTYSSIRGKVRDAEGNSVTGLTIIVVDTRTGISRSYTTNDSGSFLAARLPVGGPFEVLVPGKEPVVVTYIGVGDTYNLELSSEPDSGISEEVIVMGQSFVAADTTSGPSAVFSIEDINNSVAFDRDIKDVFMLDPRMSLDDPTEGTAVNCAGRHPRFNSVTLDGVSYNDRFGLNNNGYSTATGMPFPFASIESVSVELAPFDVTYGGFSACNINAVTKSGGNEWHGSVFYEFSNNDLRGDSFKQHGETVDVDPIDDETKMGLSFGGPLITDKLYFFAAYEESEVAAATAMGYSGSGVGDEREWLSEEDYNRIVEIANDLYDYDPGGMPGNGVIEDKKLMARIDWIISDQHEAAFVYNYYDGYEDRASDNDDNEFEFANHFYVKGAESTTFTAKIASQWTDALSTEFYYSTSDMDDSQVTVGPKDFGEVQIGIGGRTGTVYLGADDSRQANKLSTESDYLKLNAQYLAGDHIITAGFEREKLSVFNMFVQHSNGGEYRFYDDSASNPESCAALDAQGRLDAAECGTSGIDKFELGLTSRIYYGSGGGTNNPVDAAASYDLTVSTLYLQDEWYIENLDLTVVAGLRYDKFTTDDAPNYNPVFSEANGFPNNATIDGLDILMPRLGITWDASPELTLRGGLGLYSGGNPNVWISNSWSNDGVTNVQLLRFFDDSLFDLDLTGAGMPGYDVPQSMVDEVLATTPEDGFDSNLALVDPDYEQPSELKLALGATYSFPNDYTLQVDLLTSRMYDSAYYVDVSQEVVGETILGQPIYDYTVGEDNYMLTNSDEIAESSTLSFILSKSFDFGLDTYLGYAYTDAEDVAPMTSATASSNYSATALLDSNDPTPGTTNYQVAHRFTMKLTYAKDFFNGYTTRFSLLGYSQEGQGQSYVMGSSDLEGDGYYGRHLLYVPTGLDDPNVVFADGFDTDAFFAWIADEGLDSGFVKRNGVKARWTTKFDFRVDQELPTFIGDTKGKVFLKIKNIGNMLNKDWGVETDAQFYSQQVVDTAINENGQYVYSNFREGDVNNTIDAYSVWQARVGVEFKF